MLHSDREGRHWQLRLRLRMWNQLAIQKRQAISVKYNKTQYPIIGLHEDNGVVRSLE